MSAWRRSPLPVGAEAQVRVVTVQRLSAAVVEVNGEGQDRAQRDGRGYVLPAGRVERRTGAQPQIRHGDHLRASRHIVC